MSRFERPFIAALTEMIRGTTAASALALVANLAVFWREILVAAAFGVGAALDVFILASLLPVFLGSLLAGAVAPALAPALMKWRTSAPTLAPVRLAATHLSSLVLSLFLVMPLWILAPHVLEAVGTNLSSDSLEEGAYLMRLLLPFISIQLSSAIWRLALNLDRRIVLSGLTPALAPLLSSAFLVANLQADFGITVLAIGLLVGSLAEWLLLAIAGWRTHSWTWQIFALDSRWRLAADYLTLVFAGLFTASAWIVDNAMASSLREGSMAALSFGGKVVTFGVTLVSVGLTTAMLPVASELVERQRWQQLRAVVYRFGSLLLLVSAPVASAIHAWSAPIVALVFERGSFSPADTLLVGEVQAALAVQVPLHIVGVFCVRLLSALGGHRQVMVIAAGGTLLNAGLNWILMQTSGVIGIAWATSCMFSATGIAAFLALRREIETRSRAPTRVGPA